MRTDPPSSSDDRTQPPRSVTPQGETVTQPPVDVSVTLSASATPPPSRTLPSQLPASFGRYQLIKLLGQGGMGAVYLAHDSQLDRSVALKMPSFTPADGPSALERFHREARAAATLQHANVCPVYDVGEIDGIHYLTMAYIEGRSLGEVLRGNKNPLTPRQAAALVRKLALALQEAHRHKVIHRDLKPGNIMLTRRGEPIIMDFGLARRGNTQDVRLTQQGAIMGTPAYMAPEQAKGNLDEMGAGCDIYSLGVILYELLTGRLPFVGDTFAILSQVLVDEPTPPSRHRPTVDVRIETICLKAMAKKPADRYPSMADFAAALADYLKDPDQTVALEAPLEPSSASPPRRKRRWVVGAILAGLAIMLLGAAAVFHALRDNRTVSNETPEDPSQAAEIEADALVAYTWPIDALREGKIPAPNLSQVKPLFQDEFDDPASGFAKGKLAKGARGYRDGKYFIDMPFRGFLFWTIPLERTKPVRHLEDFACQAVGQASGRQTSWGLCIVNRTAPPESHRLIVSISNAGRLHVQMGKDKEKPLQPSLAHSAIKKGNPISNTLLVVLRGRQLEIYVNAVAVCDPIFLEHAIPAPRLALEGRTGTLQGGTVEFERITVWPADSIPPLETRGANPKR